MQAFFSSGRLTLVPQTTEEKEFVHSLYTQVMFSENPTNIADPVDAVRWSEDDGRVVLATKSVKEMGETRLR